MTRSARQVRAFYDRIAPGYDRWLRHYDRWMRVPESRRHLVSAASGRTLELGVGTGVNLPLYPADVELTAIDLSPRMLEVARERALRLRLRVDLIVGDARDLPFADEVFETVTATHFFSAVPDPDVAIAEAIRVLRRGGRLLILDHIASDNRPVRFLQRALGPLLARVTGWNMNSEPSETVSARGLVIERRRRSRRGMLEELVARKPA